MSHCDSVEGILLGCPRCGGLWIDNAISASLVDGTLENEVGTFVRAVDEHAEGSSADAGVYRDGAAGEMSCLECGVGLQTVVVQDVEIDICEAHGAFFDHLEVRAYQFEKATQKAGVSARAAQSAAAHGQELRAFRHDLGAPTAEQRRQRGSQGRLLNGIIDQIRAWRRPT